MLSQLGYRVDTAASGREAVRLFEESSAQTPAPRSGCPYDLLVMDMVMEEGLAMDDAESADAGFDGAATTTAAARAADVDSAASAVTSEDAAGGGEFSGTNNQEVGVDEAATASRSSTSRGPSPG